VWAKRPAEEVARAELIAVANVELQRFDYLTRAQGSLVDEVDEVIRSAVHGPPRTAPPVPLAPVPTQSDKPDATATPGTLPADDAGDRQPPTYPDWIDDDLEESFVWI
jgi:hypothetical protein